MEGTITVTGLGSGTDFSRVIEELVNLEHYQVDRLEVWKTEWEEKIESIQGLNSRLLSMETFVNDYNTTPEFLSTTATSSDETVVTATSDSEATPGAHTVVVGSNISHRLSSQGWASQTTAIGGHDGAANDTEEDFEFTFGSTTITVSDADFTTATTLSDFKDDIENAITAAGQTDHVGVEILDDGSGTNPYRMVLYSKDGGDDNRISVTKNPTGLTFSSGCINPATIDADDTWTDGESRPTSHGTYTGSIDKKYTFTVPGGTVGTGDLTVNWSESETGRSGTITIPNGYEEGTQIDVDGINDPVKLDTWTGTSDPSTSGNYTGSVRKTYTFTVPSLTLDGANAEDTVTWTDSEGNSGSVTIPANYAGSDLLVEDGVYISFSVGGDTLVDGEQFTAEVERGPKVSFSEGDLTNNDEFYIDTFTNVDDVEEDAAWSGTSSATSWGHYLGSTNKTFEFTLLNSGTIGTDAIGLSWSDSEGNSGTVTIPDDFNPSDEDTLSVSQGLELKFSAGNLIINDEFSIHAYSPDLQKGQDSGMARAEELIHSGFSDENSTAVTGTDQTFTYTYAGQRVSVDVDADTTLSGLVSLINSDTDNPGVKASILDDGLGLATSYHLVVRGLDTGAAYNFNDISDTFTGGTFSSDDFTTNQEAQNSMLKVDGYPTDDYEYIQRQNNYITDVIEDVNLSLVDSGTSTVTISEDIDTIRGTIETFVTSVNFVLDYIKEETKYDSSTGEAGTMLGNYSYQMVQQRINEILTDSVPDLTDGEDTYVHLAQIGITTNPDNDGKWEIDDTTLNSALNSDLDAVAKLFARDETADTDGILELLSEELESLTDSDDGPMNILIDNYEGIIDGIDTRIEREERRIALVEDRLENQFARLEALLVKLSGQEAYLQQLIDQLPTIGG